MALVVGQILRTRYQIQLLLGQGGFGAVYQAADLNLQRIVAVKENLDASPTAQKQFQREAQMLVPLRHANLPQILDYFIEANGQQYLVMEFVAGSTLRQLAQQNGALLEAQVLPWANQILDALQELHANNPPIIHRDIKPDNVIITPRGSAMLVDFGIAKAAMPGMPTTIGARAVSPGYSPPEQYGNAPTDARSDIYAFGATLYFVLTGVEPPESIQRIITSMPLVPPRQYNARISQEVQNTILKAMEIRPELRQQDILTLRQGFDVVIQTPSTLIDPSVQTTFPIPKRKCNYFRTSIAIGNFVTAITFFIMLSLAIAIPSSFPLMLIGLVVPILLGIFNARASRQGNAGRLGFTQAIVIGGLTGAGNSILVVVLMSACSLFALLTSSSTTARLGGLMLTVGVFGLSVTFSAIGSICYRALTGA